jgi:pyruvate formate lyase activating enzyme
MRIAGLEKNSFVDYPGKMAAVIFTPGCNMDCYYCHNQQLLAPDETDVLHDPKDVLAFLQARHTLLDAVVITGGEPTLQKELESFITRVRDTGLLVKLDTNGSHPWILRSLLDKKLLDFVAMDIKAPLEKYNDITGTTTDVSAINQSIDLLMSGDVEYEFRTTFAPPLTTVDIVAIASRIHHAASYIVQQYRPVGRGVDMFGVVDSPQPHNEAYVAEAAMLAGKFVKRCETRGLSSLVPKLELLAKNSSKPTSESQSATPVSIGV